MNLFEHLTLGEIIDGICHYQKCKCEDCSKIVNQMQSVIEERKTRGKIDVIIPCLECKAPLRFINGYREDDVQGGLKSFCMQCIKKHKSA